ncbi:putative RNA methyltransferase-domain-containing protein [Phakopsora pachyrhizi]|nr:putative RNA methyltransferase-domain-containing protein [Phakopsora pachyrhizi]
MDVLDQSQPRHKKRRRRSSGKFKKDAKEAIKKSTAYLLSQASDSTSSDSSEQAGRETIPSIPEKDTDKNFIADGTTSNAVDSGLRISVQDQTLEFSRLHKPQKPSADVTTGKARNFTISIALPGDILNNAQTWELKTALVGQIARACAIFSVDEIIIFEENLPPPAQTCHNLASKLVTSVRNKYRNPEQNREELDDDSEAFRPSHFFNRILEYLECPQYLRKSLFPLHPDLRLAGLLPPLDLPHHLRKEHVSPWREGCVLPKDVTQNYLSGHARKGGSGKKKSLVGVNFVWVDVGLDEPIQAMIKEDVTVPDWARVTVQMPSEKLKHARLVSPRAPTEHSGLYWGYSVRLASSISKVFTESPYVTDGGYDLTIGTSERGQGVDSVIDRMNDFNHLLLVLGGLSGLELCIASDSTLEPCLKAEDAHLLFDYWINTLPYQGSRTIRTEEALVVSLGALRKLFSRS